MKEIWKDIKGYEGKYQVSNYGRVKRLERIVNNNGGCRILPEKICRQYSTSDTLYYRVCLTKDGKVKMKNVHRLVAEAFIPNPDNFPCVDHIDRDRKNNSVNNLRWVDYKINIYNRSINHKPDIKYINGKYLLRFSCFGERFSLKYYDTKEEAEEKSNKLFSIYQNLIDELLLKD